MDIVTSILIKVIKDGNIIRIIDKKSNNKFVAILDKRPKYSNLINILTNKTNFIGDLFIVGNKEKTIINLQDYDVSTISIDEYTIFKNIIIEAMNNELITEVKTAYAKVLYKIDEIIKNSKEITANLIKTGYRMYPKQKIEIFNRIVTKNKYINENVPSTFIASNVLLSSTKKLIKRPLKIIKQQNRN